jgi:hypothetical protein
LLLGLAMQASMLLSRTGWTLDCHFVGRREKPEKPLHSSSLSRPVDTTQAMKWIERPI